VCGIAGILGRLNDGNRTALKRMSDAMSHRGPDSQGTWESAPDPDGRGVLFAHRRLAIIDLSPAGAQPMVDPVTKNVIVFNGEIYNFQSLRQRLSAEGERFDSTGDTAVMLRALGRHGPDAIRELRGMFAFAAWDPHRRELLVARDPLGIKPLYLARNPDPDASWSLAFASEVRALLASGLLPNPRLDPRAAASVVWNGFVVGPYTAVRGVECFSPGHFRVFDATGRTKRSQKYWSVPPEPCREPMDEARLAPVLEECLRLHLISDVPLAVFLSSGVDSSAVANLAKRASNGPIHTFTLAFEDPQLNEGEAARRIAAAIGTEHQEVLFTEEQFVGGLDSALDSIDQPTFDGLNSYSLSRAIREAGFTVALVGTGGDELLGGYRSFRELPTLLRWSKRLDALPRGAVVRAARVIAAILQPARGSFSPQTRWAKLPEMVRRGDDLLALYQLAYALFLPAFQEELICGVAEGIKDGLPEELRAQLAAETALRSPVSAISVMEQRLFLGERLLRDNDAASMAWSIEQRLPLVDQVLSDAVDRLSDEIRYEPIGRKSILRRVGLAGLDPALFERPKAGFVMPYDRWIRGGLQRTIDETLRDPAAVAAAGLAPAAVARLWQAFRSGAKGLYWSRIWALFVLVRWCQRHGVRR